jgi:hypothetical protein
MSARGVLDEVTFVVQGGINSQIEKEFAKKCTNSIRKHFPTANLILSTWEESDIEGISFDSLIFNKDPGAVGLDKSIMNINRQILSTQSGLRQSKTLFSVKVRNDLYFTNDNLTNYINLMNELEKRDSNLFEKPVLVTNVTSVNPEKRIKRPLHPCDWIYVGLTSDLQDLFDIPFYPKEYESYFENRELPKLWPHSKYYVRYPAESYIYSSYLKNFMPLLFDHGSHASKENLDLSIKLFSEEFIVLPHHLIGMKSSKHRIEQFELNNMYGYHQWKKISAYGELFPHKYREVITFYLMRNIYLILRKSQSIAQKALRKSRSGRLRLRKKWPCSLVSIFDRKNHQKTDS